MAASDVQLLVHCFRHGESAANAGSVTTDPGLIPLTDKGREQALVVARQLQVRPDLIVCSPFLRALDTAAPTRARFADVSFEQWPIHEFTYLSPARCAGTAGAERRPWVQAYWDAADVQRVDGEGAESFAAFMGRVNDALLRITAMASSSCPKVFVFGHGQFLQALRWRINEAVEVVDAEAMRAFRELDHHNPIANAQGFVLQFDGKKWSVQAG